MRHSRTTITNSMLVTTRALSVIRATDHRGNELVVAIKSDREVAVALSIAIDVAVGKVVLIAPLLDIIPFMVCTRN